MNEINKSDEEKYNLEVKALLYVFSCITMRESIYGALDYQDTNNLKIMQKAIKHIINKRAK
jgi:hypothetical protein